MKHINTLYGNVQPLSVTNAYHWSMKWKTFTVDTRTFTDKSNCSRRAEFPLRKLCSAYALRNKTSCSYLDHYNYGTSISFQDGCLVFGENSHSNYCISWPIRRTVFFSLEILEEKNDECILILVIYWKKT
jgi:hypothetical protein